MYRNIARYGIAAIVAGALLLAPLGAIAASLPDASAASVSTTGGTGSSAQFQPLTDVSGTPFASIFSANSTLSGFFQTLFKVSITIGGLLAVLEIAYGGWLYMTTDIVDKRGEAKKRIQNALLGLLMLLATVLILNQINPDITSLQLLQTSGTSRGATQQQTTGTSAATTGQQSTEGFGTYNPSGNYCVSTGIGNASQTGQQYYTCYTTDAACEQQNGSNGNCTAYSTSYLTNDISYSPGTEHDTTLPDDAADYAQFSWVSNAGYDSNGNLNECSTTVGTGWTEVAANMCGGALESSMSECCALSKEAAAALAQASTTASGEKYDAEDQASITIGDWCYLDNSDTYSCFPQKSSCSADLGVATSTGVADDDSKLRHASNADYLDDNGFGTVMRACKRLTLRAQLMRGFRGRHEYARAIIPARPSRYT